MTALLERTGALVPVFLLLGRARERDALVPLSVQPLFRRRRPFLRRRGVGVLIGGGRGGTITGAGVGVGGVTVGGAGAGKVLAAAL